MRKTDFAYFSILISQILMIQPFFPFDGSEDGTPSPQLSIIKGLLRSFNWREQILPPAKLQPSKFKIRKTYLEKEGFLFDAYAF